VRGRGGRDGGLGELRRGGWSLPVASSVGEALHGVRSRCVNETKRGKTARAEQKQRKGNQPRGPERERLSSIKSRLTQNSWFFLSTASFLNLSAKSSPSLLSEPDLSLPEDDTDENSEIE
jgi:hypothetical protein